MVELLVVIAIGAILATLSATAIGPMVLSNSLSQGISQVQGQVNLARQTAITLNRQVELRFYVDTKTYGAPAVTSLQVVVPPSDIDPATLTPPVESTATPSSPLQKTTILPQNIVIAGADLQTPDIINGPTFVQSPPPMYPALPNNVTSYFFLTFTTTGSVIQQPSSSTDNFLTFSVVPYSLYKAKGSVTGLSNYGTFNLNYVTGTYTIVRP